MTRKPFNKVSPKTKQTRTRWKKWEMSHKLFIKIRVSEEEKKQFTEYGKRHPKGISGLIRDYLNSLTTDAVPTASVVPTPMEPCPLLTDKDPDTNPDTEAHLKAGSSSLMLVSNCLTTQTRLSGREEPPSPDIPNPRIKVGQVPLED